MDWKHRSHVALHFRNYISILRKATISSSPKFDSHSINLSLGTAASPSKNRELGIGLLSQAVRSDIMWPTSLLL